MVQWIGSASAAGLSGPMVRVLAAIAALVFATLSIQMYLAPAYLAPSTDERTHQQRLQNWFRHGYYLPNKFLEEGVPIDNLQPGRIHAYGPAWSLSAHALNVVRGEERWGEISWKPRPMEKRNHMSVLLGILAALAVAYSVAVTASSWALGLWAGAAVLAIPSWTGYSMFHPKDIPVGAGYTMLSAGLAIALAHRTRWDEIVVAVLCALGIFYGVGTRTAMWVPFMGSIVLFGILAAIRGRSFAGVLAGTGVGLLAVLAVNYRHVIDFRDWLIGSISVSSAFPTERSTLTAGVMVPSWDAPWWYLPAWFGTSIPLAILALAILACGILIYRLLWGLSLRSRFAHGDVGYLLFAMQATGLVTIAVIAGSTVYGGLRQHLYVLPAVAALAAMAVAWLLKRFPTWLTVSLVSLAVLVPTIEQSRLFPFNNIYKNVLAHPIDDRWETDMHLVSYREAMNLAPKKEIPVCRKDTEGRCWRRLRTMGRLPVPEGCILYDQVKRPLRWETLILTRLVVCEKSVLP